MGFVLRRSDRHPPRRAALPGHGTEAVAGALHRSGVRSGRQVTRSRVGGTTMRTRGIGALLAAFVCLAGCAHPMTVRPDVGRLPVAAQASRIPKAVGLYISPENLNKEVVTPGGGGDKVSYK